LPALLDEVEGGQDVESTMHGRVVARLARLASHERATLAIPLHASPDSIVSPNSS